MKLNYRGTIDKVEIHKIYELIGHELDSDYYSFLNVNNGAICENCMVYIGDLSQDIAIDNLFGINLPVETSNLTFWINEYGDELPPQSILIGSEPGGGFFLLLNKQGVYYWDHSWFFEQSVEENNTYFVAKSFTDFMKMMKSY